MPMKPDDRLASGPRGDAATATAWVVANGAKRPADAVDLIDELYRLGTIVGIDPAIAVAQAIHETGNFSSSWWTDRLNPAGIGITGDPAQDDRSRTWTDGVSAARSQLAHLLLYTFGRIDRGGLTPADDPRYDAYVAAYGANKSRATTIASLAGQWAADPAYATGICARGNTVFADLPDQGATPTVPTNPTPSPLNMIRGLIPMPSFINDPIDVSQRDQSIECRGYDDLGVRPRPPVGVVLHRSVNGAGTSNSGYYHETCCPALTDYEVIAATGQGRRFVPPGSRIAGWANGVVSAPYGDALAWLNQHGFDLNTVNRDWESCEVTGQYDDAVTDKAWQWLAQWIASRAHDYGIAWSDFPLVAAEGSRSYVTWHQEWTIGTGKICPGPVVMNYTPTLIERARALMKTAQTTGVLPTKPPIKQPYASPDVDVLAFVAADLKLGYPTDHTWKGLKVYAAKRTYETIKPTGRLQFPDPSAPAVGPKVAVRTTLVGDYWLVATDAKGTKRAYVLTHFGTFLNASALTPAVAIRPR